MHKPNCKSLIVLTSYPPIYQDCDCGYLDDKYKPDVDYWAGYNAAKKESAEIFRQGYLEGVQDCIAIANNERFLDDDGKHIRAMSALWNIIMNMHKLKGEL